MRERPRHGAKAKTGLGTNRRRSHRDPGLKVFARMGHGDVLDSLPAELFDCFVAGEAMPGYFLAYQSLLHRSLRIASMPRPKAS